LIKSQPPQGDWWVKLSDFGLSKRIKAPTEMVSKVLGTLQYMAPELLSHEPGCSTQVDHRAADMWSLGEMVHRMLTATAVFPSQLALIRYTLRPDSLPSHELTRHGASSNAISFIHALMKPTPEHRLTADKGLEHAWIQPCQSFRANSSLSRSGTPSPAYDLLSLFVSVSP
jgi:serine/threonine protein kinase